MTRSSGSAPICRGVAFALTLAALSILGLAACTTGGTPSPTAGPSGSAGATSLPSPSRIDTPAAAAAAVVASDPRFTGIGPADPNVVGRCCWSSAVAAPGGFTVTIEIGWGDCPAGCINRHDWFYTVTTDGAIHLDRESGPPVPAGVPGAAGSDAAVVGIHGVATAGPVCPVVRPNDSSCADRPVAGATVHVIDASGTEVATVQTDAVGSFTVALPPGSYHLVPDPVVGLMGTARPVDATVAAGLAEVDLGYDTGIR